METLENSAESCKEFYIKRNVTFLNNEMNFLIKFIK